MSHLYIYEAQSMIRDVNGFDVPVAGNAVATQKVTSGASSNRSSAFNSATRFVHLKAKGGDMHVKFGDDSVSASTSDWILDDGEVMSFGVENNTHVAVIDA